MLIGSTREAAVSSRVSMGSTWACRAGAVLLAVAGVQLEPASGANAGPWGATTTRVSVGSAGGQGNADSRVNSSVFSSSTRYVAFVSKASNLVPGDTNDNYDVFVRDRLTAVTQRASV